jgi:peptidoglycan/xylan/chitin deacetylase (PgdA/CDA1 family)
LKQQDIKASFFLTGNFYRNSKFKPIVQLLADDGHYLGSHSDKHLLYCDWTKRDSLLVTRQQFTDDLQHSYDELAKYGISKQRAHYFLPPYEWYNDRLSTWCKEADIQLINYTPGTLSHADYTTKRDKNYRSSETIYNSIINYEKVQPAGLNGFILLMHIGAGPDRTDKFYYRLPGLIRSLKQKGYHFQTVEQLLSR